MGVENSRTTPLEWNGYHIRLFNRMSLDVALRTYCADAEALHRSRKATVDRVGRYVVKRSRSDRGRSVAKFTLAPGRYRGIWKRWLALQDAGVRTPHLYAYLERWRLGLTVETGVIMEYLEGQIDLRQYARTRLDAASQPQQRAFLEHLAEAVMGLERAGAWHGDLKSENIFTADGESFSFLDMEAVRYPAMHTRDRRIKNHSQLYFNLMGAVDEKLLDGFIRSLTPGDVEANRWLEWVAGGAEARLARTRLVWKRLGLSEEALGYEPRRGR